MTMPMNVARGLLTQAEQDLERFRAALVAAASGPRGQAHQKVSAVFRGGYELRRLNEVLGRMEGLNNDLHQLIAKTNGIIAAIREVKGG